MMAQTAYHRPVQLVAYAWLIAAASASTGKHDDDGTSISSSTGDTYYHGGYGGPWSGSSPNPNPNSGSGFGPPPPGGADGFAGGPGGAMTMAVDMETVANYRRAHGIMAAVAMAALFPLGSVLVRLLPAGRLAVWAHAGWQALALCVFVAAAGLGIRVGSMVQTPGGNLFEISSIRYHLIIGLVVLGLLVLQPFLGIMHHVRFKKLRRRQVWSYLHLGNGRVVITLGIVNGGLGLHVAREATRFVIAYSVVAGVMWLLWMLAAVWGEVKRRKTRDGGKGVGQKELGGAEARESDEGATGRKAEYR
ncbi:hypothetical protein VTK26DRAFT_2573 [Humicola hyalothermophila]